MLSLRWARRPRPPPADIRPEAVRRVVVVVVLRSSHFLPILPRRIARGNPYVARTTYDRSAVTRWPNGGLVYPSDEIRAGLSKIRPRRQDFARLSELANASVAAGAGRVVGVGGFEPPASCSQSKRANQAAPHPEDGES